MNSAPQPSPASDPRSPDPDPDPGEVTQLLAAAGTGRDSDRLLELVYAELRRLAGAQMQRESAGLTLQPTALVHEAWLRLVQSGERTFEGRVHFFRTAARAMRRILVDRARRVDRAKHGGQLERVTLDDSRDAPDASTGLALDLVDLNDALAELEAFDPRLSELVALRWLAGLSVEETADALGLSSRSVKREWSVARAWLARRLESREET